MEGIVKTIDHTRSWRAEGNHVALEKGKSLCHQDISTLRQNEILRSRFHPQSHKISTSGSWLGLLKHSRPEPQ